MSCKMPRSIAIRARNPVSGWRISIGYLLDGEYQVDISRVNLTDIRPIENIRHTDIGFSTQESWKPNIQ